MQRTRRPKSLRRRKSEAPTCLVCNLADHWRRSCRTRGAVRCPGKARASQAPAVPTYTRDSPATPHLCAACERRCERRDAQRENARLGAGHIVRGTEPPLLVNVHQIDVISTVDVQPGIGSVRKIGHGTWSPGIGFRRPRSAATCSLQVVNRGTRHPMQLLAETSTVQIVLTKRGPPPFVEDKVGDGRRRLFATTS